MKPVITLPKGQFTTLNDVTIPGLISAAVNLLLVVASLLFIFNLLFGGIKFIISGGDKERVDNAKRQLLNALIGIFVVYCSWAILNFVSTFFGINLLSFEIPTL